MKDFVFSGVIAKVTPNRTEAIVKLDEETGGVTFAVLRRTLIGNQFLFELGMRIYGTGSVKGQTLVAKVAYSAKEQIR